MSTHAYLSASGSHRWLNCPGSAALEATLPDVQTVYSMEGTAAHKLADLCLSEGLRPAEAILGDGPWNDYPDNVRQDMVLHVQTYMDLLAEDIAEAALAGFYDAAPEIRVDFSAWVPRGFGTSDFILISPGKLTVYDLKYGAGVRVMARWNSQGLLYCLGALDANNLIYGIEQVEFVIVQPRMDHVDRWSISVEDLLAWGEHVKDRATIALSDDAPLIPGEKQCQFCKAKAVCRARAEANLKLAMEEFAEPMPEPATLSMAEIGALLPRLDELRNWAKAVDEYALQQALQGADVPGHKLVEGRSIRVWTANAEAALRSAGLTDDVLYDRKLIGVTAAEKLLGGKVKAAPVLDGATFKPAGKPTLVPLSDKRAELNTASSAARDFSDAA